MGPYYKNADTSWVMGWVEGVLTKYGTIWAQNNLIINYKLLKWITDKLMDAGGFLF